MNKQITLLDHGFVRLIDSMGTDLSVVRSARVSYDAAWRAGEDTGSDYRLINYMWKNLHMTPFESVVFTFEVKAPIFVFRQWHRHRTWAYNELSARYKELPEVFYLPEAFLVGVQDIKNKQQRKLKNLTDEELEKVKEEIKLAEQTMQNCFSTYRYLLRQGWPRELARSVLPLATYSHMFGTVNLRNLLAFLSLRNDPECAQHEILVYAEAMRELARTVVPVCIEAWESTRKT